jgi:hypothetical protein
MKKDEIVKIRNINDNEAKNHHFSNSSLPAGHDASLGTDES